VIIEYYFSDFLCNTKVKTRVSLDTGQEGHGNKYWNRFPQCGSEIFVFPFLV
jgi:hypothetical protein